MRLGKKKESLLGLILTAVLCLGFLWWWFRPVPQPWQEQTAAQLVARAMQEPRSTRRVEQQILDFDLMEIALSQVRERRKDEALAISRKISDPVLRTLTARQLAHAYLGSDPQDFGEALDFAALVVDPAQQTSVRTDILGMLAAAGFPDAALPEAKTPLQKAILANHISDADNKVRELLTDAEAALPSLPPADAAAVRLEIARGRVALCRSDPPASAIAAIKALPAAEQGELWAELTSLCQGRDDKEQTVPLVFQQITEPALRRRMEIESLIFGVKLRPAAEILADCAADINAAPSPGARIAAMLILSKAQYDSDEATLKATATATLKNALQLAPSITDSADRCRALLSLARRFSDVLLFDDSRAALNAATAAARTVTEPAARIQLLVAAADENFNQAAEPTASQLIEEAAATFQAATAAPDAVAIQPLAAALIRRGDWSRALALVDRITAEPVRLAALENVARTVAEDCISVDPANPPPRGEPLDGIRRTAITDQAKATNLAQAQPEGFPRARAWLAMAKAIFTPPVSLSDYMAAGAQPGDEAPPDAPPETPADLPPDEDQPPAKSQGQPLPK